MKIVGVNRKTRTKATAISNIRKFLEIYRRTKQLPNVFFVSDEAIYAKTPHLIIHLMEELIRTVSGAPHSHGVAVVPFLLEEEGERRKFSEPSIGDMEEMSPR